VKKRQDKRWRWGGRRGLVAGAVLAVGAALPLMGLTALGSSVGSAALSGGAGTVSAAGTLYAKSGGVLTLTVNTSSDTKCVEVSGAFTARQTVATAKSTWTFSFTAGTGDGVRTVTASASPNFNANNCTGQSQSPQSASFVLDNTGPVVTGTASPQPNAAGWNNGNVAIAWSATDAGSGVASGPSPASDSQTTNTAGTTKTASATDRLGNQNTGSVTVKLDKALPAITGSRSPAPNANGWNNTNIAVSFTCSDALAGIRSCPATTTLTTSGAGQSVTGTATDNADNAASATVSGLSIDKVAPTLSGAPTTSPNADGWYQGDVTIHWTANDDVSGLAGSSPADSTISSEGAGLTASASVSDLAGNTTSASSTPAVNIDRTAPQTIATAPTRWNNTDVTVELDAADALSGVAATYYILDGAAQQAGTSVSIKTEGDHTLRWWSLDNAGNSEEPRTVDITIDRTPPSIDHTQSPAANANGWNNADVTVTFTCADALSGIASCTSPQTVDGEGQNQAVTGSAVDNAGNTATDPATVSLDETQPAISAAADGTPNSDGWYDHAVTVSFTCHDALSGIDACPAPKTVGEGADQSASGTAVDAAGNSASEGVSGIDVDATPPSLHGAPTTEPNANGWYRGDVTVNWTAADALSGLAGDPPADATIGGEGSDLSASASVRDRAGNTTNATVGGIRIDRTPPATSATVPVPLDSGWYAGEVEVTLTAGPDLSGIEDTYYSIDGGDPHEYDAPFIDAQRGEHAITFWSVDKAGNSEDRTAPQNTITVRIDGVPPTITGSRAPAANLNGWNDTEVSVSFDCADAESGIAACTTPLTLVGEGAGQTVAGQAQDNAGNVTHATVEDINIDLTPPALAGSVVQNPTNDPFNHDWYNGDVTVHWTATDGLSGIDPVTAPTNSTITGEGRGLSAGPVSVADLAGNTASATFSPIGPHAVNIDRHGPVITGTPTTSPNAAGWYDGAVTVGFDCADPKLADGLAGSGVATCPSSKVLDSNGANQSVTSGEAVDYAGNAVEGVTVGGIDIDGSPPQTTADNQCTARNGWCTGSTAAVVLSASDVGPSGVSEIHYKVGDEAWQIAPGASTSVNVPLDGSGIATVQFYAVDVAGNVELQNVAELEHDNIAPKVTHSFDPLANAGGWSNADTLVHFVARDDDAGSGVDASTLTPDVMVSNEGSHVVTGQASDIAGNTGYDEATVRLDRTAPTIVAAITGGTLGSNGWYVTPPIVSFTCSDPDGANRQPGSGVAVCPDPVGVTTNGAHQTVTRTAKDAADNTASATVADIAVDQEPPTIRVVNVSNGLYVLGAVPTPTCTASDSYSGVGSCNVAVSGGLPNGVGTFNYVATAADSAGNTATLTGSYRVVYAVARDQAFFLQPVNDTDRVTTLATSVSKAGSTIPVKFQLRNAAGSVVQANTAPLWVLPAKGSPITAAVNESAFSAPADTTSTFRWDPTARQYIYNWNTEKTQAGSYWRIGVRLDDGQTHGVNIGLR
jgi:hypothetical protein